MTYEQTAPGVYRVTYSNGVLVGEMIRDVDGFFYFWPETSRGGCWSEHVLRELAIWLDVQNEPWQSQINQYFEEQYAETNANSIEES